LIVELLVVAAGGADQQRVLQIVVVGRELDTTQVQVDESRRVALGLVQLDQAIDGERALRVELERLFVAGDRARRVVEHVALGLGHAPPDAGALFVVRQKLGLSGQDSHQNLPVAE